MNRRELLRTGIGALALMAGVRPARASTARLRVGYAAITWRGDDREAIDDIAALGFGGIQLRTSAFGEWSERPAALRELLAERGLTMVALSSGTVGIEPAAEADDRATHLRHARFLRDIGGLYLQVIDRRPRDRPPTADDLRRLGRLLTELGRGVTDLGVRMGYHHHMGSLGEAPEEIARIMDATDADLHGAHGSRLPLRGGRVEAREPVTERGSPRRGAISGRSAGSTPLAGPSAVRSGPWAARRPHRTPRSYCA